MGSESLTYAVSHRTTLRYTESVGISFNEVRMRPRDRGSQRTLTFSLLSNPAAVPRSRVDYFGNYVHRVDVTTPHRRPRVRHGGGGGEQRAATAADAQLDRRSVLASDPRPGVRAPQPAGADRRAHRRPLARLERRGARLRCRRWPRRGAFPTSCATSPAPPRWSSSIEDLLEGGAGVCQDFTHLFLAMVRGAGWPARYVERLPGPVR